MEQSVVLRVVFPPGSGMERLVVVLFFFVLTSRAAPPKQGIASREFAFAPKLTVGQALIQVKAETSLVAEVLVRGAKQESVSFGFAHCLSGMRPLFACVC